MNSGRKYYFLTIADTLNITRAAEKLMVSQPSLTQYLNRLEAELEVRLVDRNYTPLRLTEAGRLYQAYLEEEKIREDRFLTDLEQLKNANRVPFQIGIPLQKHDAKLSQAVLDFCMKRPSMDMRVWEGTSATVRERVVKGELDIGFGHSVEAEDEECETRVLKREKLLILCNRENPMVRGRESDENHPVDIQPEVLERQLFYQMSQEYYLCTVELEHLKQHRVSPKKKLVMSNLHGIVDAIVKNPSTGFAYMPDYVLEEPGPREAKCFLAFLRLDGEDFIWYYCMKRKKGKKPTADAKDFWNTIVKTCFE